MSSKRKEFNGKPSKKASSTHAKKQKQENEAPTNLKKVRQSQRKFGEEVEEAKKIWNQLRLKTNTKDQNRLLLDKMIPLIAGKSDKIALQHDGSRVIQAVVQFGTPAEKRTVVSELCATTGTIIEIAKSQYAHFCLLKVIKYCRNDEISVKNILKAFKGHMSKLAVHAVASKVVESMFTNFSTKETAPLKLEFYGPHFSLFAADMKGRVPTLQLCLSEKPDKKEKVLQFMQDLVNKGMEKSLYGFTYFQDIMDEYCLEASPNEIRTLASTAADHLIHLLSSRSGTRVAASMASYGTAKDRKRMMKSLKGYVRSGLLHRDAYLAVIRLVQVTDDTVSTQKNMINELLKKGDEAGEESTLKDLALSDTASKFLLSIIVSGPEKLKKVFDPYEQSVLFDDPKVIEDGQEMPTSKKDVNLRRTEILRHIQGDIIKLCTDHACELLQSIPGSAVLRESYSAFPSKDMASAIVQSCTKDMFEHKTGHLTLKQLIRIDSASAEQILVQEFLSVFSGRFDQFTSSNRGCLVLLSLLKSNEVRGKVQDELDIETLRKAAEASEVSAGYEALISELKG